MAELYKRSLKPRGADKQLCEDSAMLLNMAQNDVVIGLGHYESQDQHYVTITENEAVNLMSWLVRQYGKRKIAP